MTDIKRDLRKIGGHRVVTGFKIVMDNPDPFNIHTDTFTGTVIFNVRGGCLFVDDAGLSIAKKRIFGKGPVATVTTFDLELPEQKVCSLRKVKVKLVRAKDLDGHEGIVFKFFQSTEEHIDLLNVLINRLPPVDSDTQANLGQNNKSA